LFFPPLAKACGSVHLAARVSSLQPAVHVFGHTHLGWDASYDGVRYIQAPLAYPDERKRRLGTVACGNAFPHGPQPQPVLIFDAVQRSYPPRYDAGWSNFYSKHPRRPDLCHLLAPRAGRHTATLRDHAQRLAWSHNAPPRRQLCRLSLAMAAECGAARAASLPHRALRQRVSQLLGGCLAARFALRPTDLTKWPCVHRPCVDCGLTAAPCGRVCVPTAANRYQQTRGVGEVGYFKAGDARHVTPAWKLGPPNAVALEDNQQEQTPGCD
jgi:hypothetical protein